MGVGVGVGVSFSLCHTHILSYVRTTSQLSGSRKEFHTVTGVTSLTHHSRPLSVGSQVEVEVEVDVEVETEVEVEEETEEVVLVQSEHKKR